MELRVDLGDFENNMAYAKYSEIEILNAVADYALVTKNCTGTAGDALSGHTVTKFSTKDNDNDLATGACAHSHPGGWWFHKCYNTHLTGHYVPGGITGKNWYGIIWYEWKGKAYSLRYAEMKVRRNT